MIYVGYTAYEKSAIEITMKPGWYITLWHFNIQPYDHHHHQHLSSTLTTSLSLKVFQQNHTFVLLHIS